MILIMRQIHHDYRCTNERIIAMIGDQAEQVVKKWGTAETVFVIWVGIALAVLIPATLFLRGTFPLFTVIWLVVPLLVVIRSGDAHRVGFQAISWGMFLTTTAINLSALLLISVLVEPWSKSYQDLVRGAISGTPPDTTFAWLIRFEGVTAWGGLLLFSGLVTIFGEELFFRGWLLQTLQRRMKTGWAIVIQAALFTVPQLLAVLLLSPLQGGVYAVVYSWLAVGVIGGWAASHSQSIWPSLASATIWNALMVAWVL
jgi:membrane protease YdiL (CAAX protease family)